jgi:hypothetical protein
VLHVLDALEDSLSLALIDENWKLRVGRQAELRARFNAPGLTIRQMGHFQVINLDGHEITIGSMATDEQIAAEIERIRGRQKPNEKPKMSITGIEPGIFEAKIAEMKKKLADRLNGGLAKIDSAAEAGAVKMEAAVDGVVAKVDKDIEDKLAEFAQFTNGGPV